MRKIFEMVRSYRKSLGITQKYVAEKSGISYKKLSKIETGQTQLTAEDLVSICMKGFGLEPQKFFTYFISKNENRAHELLKGED